MKIQNKFTALLLVLVLTLAMIPQMPVYAEDNAVKILGEESLLPTKATVVTIQKSMGDGFAVIEHLALSDVKTGKLVSTDISYETTATEIKVSIYPHNNFSQNTAYVLKIFTDKNQYNYNLTTEKYVNFSDYETLKRQFGYNPNEQRQFTSSKDFYYKRIEVPANPAKGFYYPYFLEVPMVSDKYPSSSNSKYLMVIPNNTGPVNSAKFVEEVLERDLYGNRIGLQITGLNEMPLLIPAFPRGNGLIDSQLLDAETVKLTKAESDKLGLGNLVDIEKQMVAMINDAKEQFKANGITLNSKIVLNGFSSSGKYANRFSLIYPELVEIVIAGTAQTAPMLPYSTINGKTLNYPLGTNDFKALFGKDFNLEAYKKIKQLWYVGEYDRNEILDYMDSFSTEEASLMRSYLGYEMPDRWKETEKLMKDKGISIQFVTYQGIGHDVNSIMEIDLGNFVKENLGKESLTLIKIK